MTTKRVAWGTLAPAIGVWFLALLLLGAAKSAQGQPAAEAGVQVLTRGPVHEAFAEASMTGASAGDIVSKQPPEPIAELPPDQRPDGANVAWIPGYWSWDDDRNDFIWVSGVWRDLPPGRQWVPGYWTPVQGGWQWISGFWGEVAQTEVTYLPPPPAPLEAGPSSPAPAPDNLWTPGCWIWQDTRYVWQPGCWMPQQPDWVWVPAHYTWTPRGCVYVPGYWDHSIRHRGVMFAPVFYEHPVYTQPGYAYSPSIVIDFGVVAACLFVQPRSHHYYFGDYYDHRYEERGFYPWYAREARRYGDDPIYTHYRMMRLREDPDWDHHVQEQFTYRREHADARPPQTLALQVNLFSTRKSDMPENMLIGRSFTEAAQSKTMPMRFAPVNTDERKQLETRGQDVRRFQMERAKLETASAPPATSKEARAVRMSLPVSPVAARPAENAPGVNAPPPMPVAPKPQVVEDGGRQRISPKAETATDHPQPREMPGRTEGRPFGGRAKPNRIGPRPETPRAESTPQNVAPQERPTGKESVREETNTTAPAPSNFEKPKPERMEARPETKPTSRRQIQSRPQAVEPIHEPTKPDTSKAEVRSQPTEPKTPVPRTETKRQGGKRQPPPDKDNKDKKSVER